MCGIAGIYNTRGERIDISQLKAMSDSIAYRGPDDFGYVLIKTQTGNHISFKNTGNLLSGDDVYNLGFAHRRLSIIDLSEDGHQPMCNENGTVWLIYNGEIYNYQDLTPQLKSLGHIFKSKTDSEVIIHAYEQWGLDCFKLFNGMWALALWDTNERRLILSRDRLGVKPIYYTFQKGGKQIFSFASEMKSLVLSKAERFSPNMKEIYKFLKFGAPDTNDRTFFEGVYSVPAGHHLIIKGDNLKFVKYWDVECNNESTQNDQTLDPSDAFKDLFIDSVRLRLRSDVPVGVCLSGGLDSSSIVYVLKSFLGRRLAAFSSFYKDKGIDEEVYIDTVARDCGLQSFKTNPDGKDFLDIMERVVWHLDQPTSDSGVYSMWHVMRLARPEVKVLLDGQGGDELLGGYLLFWHVYLNSILMKSPFLFLRDVLRLAKINSLNPLLFVFRAVFPFLAIQLGRNIKTKCDNIFTDDFRSCGDGFKTKIFSDDGTFPDPTKKVMLKALKSFMLPHLLRNEDRISMAFSLESRLPFLDYRLVEFCFSLPSSLKFQNGVTKVILRNAMKSIVHEKILNRFDKMGFPTPTKNWLRSYHKDNIMGIIESQDFRQRGIFNTRKLKTMIDGFWGNKYDLSSDISRIIMLDFWFRHFIEN